MTLRGRRALALTSLLAVSTLAHAQSTAINGTIEGVAKDATGAVLPGVAIHLTNIDTGAQRSLTSGADGDFRALLLPLGTYTVRAEIQGFKAAERTGVKLSAGQIATLNFTLEVGGVQEVVSVSGEAAIAEPGRIDLGRTISETEIKNLPLVSRNPYNFAFLQANVTGYENNEFGVPRINANGTQMHTNYQIDGNTNTEKDRAGLRMLPVSEVMVKEVRVITSGFAPEFGQTTGMVYNAVTPSGTNQLSGSASYRLRRKGFSARPFFLAGTAPKPDTHVDNWTATLGGPIQKDKTHFYLGYEFVNRDLSADRVITVSPANATRLGLGSAAIPSSGVIPATQSVNFLLGKVDHQLSASNKLSARYIYFKNSSPFNIGNASRGVPNTVEQATDFNDRMDSASLQLISSIGSDRLNELRVQFARRHQFRTASDGAGTGPAITVSGVANFGGPIATVSDAGFDFNQEIWQVLDNFSWIRGRHNFKVGVDAQFIDDARVNTLFQLYTFPSVDAYLAAHSGDNPRSYTTFSQLLGDPTVSYNTRFLGAFVQDDFKISQGFKVLFGIRYDYFKIPDSRPFAANPFSSGFKVDGNNFAPRVGFSWALDEEARTVLRASSGVMYEPALLNFYEDAIQRNGDPRTVSLNLNPTSAGAPAFPGTLANLPPGFTLPRQSIVAMDPGFSTQRSGLTNVQLERALTRDMSVSVGYVNSTGRNLPVLIDTNLIPSGGTLGDGRPIYSTAVSAQSRANTAFNHIDVFQSIGSASYNALTAQVNKRMSHGFQLQASYTLAKAKDNAPLTGTYVVGSNDDRVSDPSNLDRDQGPTPFNQTHTFVFSTVIQPRLSGDGLGASLANNNQLGVIVQANSGLPFNIRANQDLNQDGVINDRPLGIARNAGRLGTVINVDARYVRFISLRGRLRAEVFAEAKNLLNRGCSVPSDYAACRANVSAVNRVVATDAAGNPTAALPNPFPGTAGYDQRAFQVGLKVAF